MCFHDNAPPIRAIFLIHNTANKDTQLRRASAKKGADAHCVTVAELARAPSAAMAASIVG
jgi:hypothetical protein